MKVLFLVSANRDTGIYTSATALAEKLRENGIQVDIDKPFSLKYDIVHIHNPLPTNISLSKMVYWNKPIVCTTNMTQDELKGLVPNFVAGLAKNYLDFFYANCDRIIATSPKIFENLQNSEHANKTIFLPHGIELKHFKKNEKAGMEFKKKFGIKKPMIFSAASIQKRKGIFDFAKVARELTQYQFVWAGQISKSIALEDKEELEKLVADKNSNIVFTGFLSPKELQAAYCASKLFIFPTHAETFGLVAVEAASNGVPVVMRNLQELENFSGFAVKFSTAKDLKEKILQLMENKKLWEKYSKLSEKNAEKFDLDKIAKKVIQNYAELFEKNDKDFFKKIASGKEFQNAKKELQKIRNELKSSISKLNELIEESSSNQMNAIAARQKDLVKLQERIKSNFRKLAKKIAE